MLISGIYTIRNTPQAHYWDIVFEWEDQLAETLHVPLIDVGEQYDQIYRPNFFKKIMNRLNAYQLKDKCFFYPSKNYLAFHIGPPSVYSFFTKPNIVPIIIDFWKYEDLRRLKSVLRLSPTIFVTSLEVYNYLQNMRLGLKIQHLSLSIPDKNAIHQHSVLRDIDIIQIGRRNAIFNEYMERFLMDYPTTHYVYARMVDNQLTIMSNKNGVMGVFKKRGEFLTLLRRSKISLVSAPGLDEDKIRTGGFSPVTPRFLESAACGCKMIGMYPKNSDFEFYGIDQVCQSIESYTAFKILATEFLNDTSVPEYKSFLEKHLTSMRAKELLLKIQELP